MNVVYNKDNLKVVSVLDNNSFQGNIEAILKRMFPKDSDSLGIFYIAKQVNLPLHLLTIGVDKNGDPNELLYKQKQVCKIDVPINNDKNKKQQLNLISSMKKMGIYCKGSHYSKFLDYLIKSPYSRPETVKNIKDGFLFGNKLMPVIWRGFFNLATGYASVGRNIVLRLHNYGIIPKLDPFPSHIEIDPLHQHFLSHYNSFDFNRLHKKCPKVLSHTPIPDNHQGKKIIYTMMETETLHPEFVTWCNRFDEVWVPCRHNYNLFANCGVRKPIYVIPLGVDETIYFKDITEEKDFSANLVPVLGDGKVKSFKYVSLFQWYSRKCPHILTRSFVKAFSDKDDVCLIIVTHALAAEHIKNEIAQHIKGIRSSCFPSIFVYNSVVTNTEMPLLYKYCNAFVSTSRGEGFSLPHIEAASCGLPIISCNHTGLSEYLRQDNSYIVEVKDREICPPDLAHCCGWYNGQIFNKLGDNEVDQFAIHMRHVVENYEEAKNKAKILQEFSKNNYTWNVTTSMVARRLHDIYQN